MVVVTVVLVFMLVLAEASNSAMSNEGGPSTAGWVQYS
jgi:hypothetical protein